MKRFPHHWIHRHSVETDNTFLQTSIPLGSVGAMLLLPATLQTDLCQLWIASRKSISPTKGQASLQPSFLLANLLPTNLVAYSIGSLLLDIHQSKLSNRQGNSPSRFIFLPSPVFLVHLPQQQRKALPSWVEWERLW